MNDNHSLSHSKWNCKYHIVFAPKYRRQVVYGQLKADIGKILRTLCEQKKVNIIEAEACPDHIHMLVEIPPNISVAQFMGYLIESIQIDLAENASAFDRPFEAQQFYSCNSSVIAIARIYVNVIHQLCISQ